MKSVTAPMSFTGHCVRSPNGHGVVGSSPKQEGSLRRSENGAEAVIASARESCHNAESVHRDCHCTATSLRDEKHSDKQFAATTEIGRAALLCPHTTIPAMLTSSSTRSGRDGAAACQGALLQAR